MQVKLIFIVDMDECAYGTHNCALTDECTNTIGSFTCSPIIGTWSQWSPFSPCSVTCGPGSKYRNRVCEDGVDCDETEAGNQEEAVCEDTICGKLRNFLLLFCDWLLPFNKCFLTF